MMIFVRHRKPQETLHEYSLMQDDLSLIKLAYVAAHYPDGIPLKVALGPFLASSDPEVREISLKLVLRIMKDRKMAAHDTSVLLDIYCTAFRLYGHAIICGEGKTTEETKERFAPKLRHIAYAHAQEDEEAEEAFMNALDDNDNFEEGEVERIIARWDGVSCSIPREEKRHVYMRPPRRHMDDSCMLDEFTIKTFVRAGRYDKLAFFLSSLRASERDKDFINSFMPDDVNFTFFP